MADEIYGPNRTASLTPLKESERRELADLLDKAQGYLANGQGSRANEQIMTALRMLRR